ncbi:hypothetical protein FA13DRAFT_1673741 [Coprinellus micaceus]|uniref:lytic cellulose monooxygenase (C4-dehydrogenating) n=1 Tax=Coprinellus micaceus TaxID=71717 RepID=A0A4Y7SDB1_COPMI|nr:hypothetical protein FA13DRAFT_1673741 [Coprinellus micaceus]
MFSSAYLLLPLLLASYVSAHGFVHQFSVNGKTYTGARPGGQRNKAASPIRQITSPNPIYGATTSAVNCGNGGGFIASEAAPVDPGDTLKFDWRGQDLSRWPHDTGPIVSYLADCGPAGCDKFDSKSARWFKIDEQGHKPNSAEWVQKDLMRGATANVKLPSNVAPGNYLMRHEIIGLHLASGFKRAEFYPSCIQLKIGGSGTGRPSANELVSFPGGYSDNDKGLFGNNFFSRQYTFPGPPLAKLTGGGGAPAPAPSSSTSTPTSTKSSSSTKAGSGSGAQPTQTTKSGGSTGSSGSSSSGPKKVCKRSASAKPTAEVRPRHLSRVMRRIAFDESVHGVSA